MPPTEYHLQGERNEIVIGLANVVAGLKHGRPKYDEEDIFLQLDNDGIYEGRPISPGPNITLEHGKGRKYQLRVTNDQDSTGNVKRANELVKRHLAEYIMKGAVQD